MIWILNSRPGWEEKQWWMMFCISPYLCYPTFIYFFFRGEGERSPPLPQILQSSFPHWGNRRGQDTRSAMGEPCPGQTTFVSMVSPLPGKYATLPLNTQFFKSSSTESRIQALSENAGQSSILIYHVVNIIMNLNRV